MDYSNGEIELSTESVLSYHWRVNGVPQPQALERSLSYLLTTMNLYSRNDEKLKLKLVCRVNVVLPSHEPLSSIVRDSVEVTPTSTTCESESKH